MKTGPAFLHEKNPSVHASPEVETVADYLRAGGESIPNQPAEKISAYLGFLANKELVNDGILTGDERSIDRQVEAASVSLTQENAEAYVKFQAKVARELGRGGEIDPERMDTQTKMDALRLVRKDQQKQLSEWAQELNSEDNKYPTWFKHWMFENVKRSTAFNDEIGKNGRPKGFEKRSRSSFALFPELDRESVSLVYDALTEKLGGQEMGFEYDNVRKLLGKAHFSELYGEAQNYGFKITDKLKAITTGSWHDFRQSDHYEDARALSDLVRSYRTGWCTAGTETAAVQLSNGDFYVWCSTNPDTGRDEVPRIAVRMEYGEVAEIRGIIGGSRQELESELADIAVEKVHGLDGGEGYFQKAQDMKRLTALDQKLTKTPDAELSAEEVSFLYELDHSIKGFGYDDRDPRILELQKRTVGPHVLQVLESLGAHDYLLNRVKNEIRFNEISKTLNDDPNAVLSNEDLRFVYGIGGLIDRLDGSAGSNVVTGEMTAKRNMLADMTQISGKTDQNDIASWLLNEPGWSFTILLRGIETGQFTQLDKTIARRILSEGYPAGGHAPQIAKHIEIFQGLTYDTLAEHLLAQGHMHDLIRALPDFKGLSTDILEKIVAAGYSSNVYNRLSSFSGVPMVDNDDPILGLSTEDKEALEYIRRYEHKVDDHGPLTDWEVELLASNDGFDNSRIGPAKAHYVQAVLGLVRQRAANSEKA